MASRRFRLFVLGFVCLWFGMLVPVHQRGQIKLPGSERARDAAPAGHCSRASDPNSACHKQRQGGREQDSPARGGDCAVCHFIAGLHAPPPAVVAEARLGFVEVLPADAPVILPLRHPALPFHGLDPPRA
jgi:hypothetical protein